MKLKITSIFISLIILCGICSADQITTNYKFIIPSEGSRDVFEILSNDIISIDTVLGILSSDTENGIISSDYVTFRAEAKASPDVTTGAPILVVSKDTSGTNHLQFYDGSGWRRVTLE